MKTLLRCQNHRVGMAHCCFSIVIKDGFRLIVPECNCKVGLGDEYAIFPDTTEKDGFLVWRECEPINRHDPYTIGCRPYQFESMTTHQTTGDEYNLPASDRNPSNFKRHDSVHPQYHMVEHNAPINRTGGLAENEPANMVGRDVPFIMSDRWHSDGYGEPYKAIGIERVRYCTGLYGMFDKKTGIVMHKAMKDWYAMIPWWKNYTRFKPRDKKKALNLFTSPWDDIEKHCMSVIKDDIILARLLESYEYIKSGEYINISALLENNGVRKQDRIKIISKIAVKNPKQIHRSTTGIRFNVEKIKRLYMAIRNDRLDIPADRREGFMANIVNFILNDKDGLSKIEPQYVSGVLKARDKYWYAIDVICSAIYKDHILKVSDLPEWFITLNHQHVKRQYVEVPEANEMGPAIELVSDVCALDADEWELFHEFVNICKVITKVTKLELRTLWEYWKKAQVKNNACIFWAFVEHIARGTDIDNICHLSSLENTTNFANEVLGQMIERDSFDIYSKPVRDSSIWETKEDKPALATTPSYDMTFNMAYVAYGAIKKQRELPMGASLDLPEPNVESAIEFTDELGYAEQIMSTPDDVETEAHVGRVDEYIDDEYLQLPPIGNFEGRANG